MARPNLNKVAATQARAEYQPQIRGVKRSTRSQVKSIRSEAPALEASLSRSGEQLRHANLSSKDLAIALAELAHRTADVGASTALQVQQAREQGHGELVDLQQAEGQAQRSALAGLQQAQAEHHQDVRDEERSDVRNFKLDLLRAQAEKQLGLGSYSTSPKEAAEIENLKHHSGMTPTQQRAAAADHANAAFYAKSLFKAAKSGEIEGVDPDPHNWNDELWSHLVENVKKRAGVDIPVAERAVQAIRDHVGGGSTSASLLQALGTVAASAAPLVAPAPLRPIAQFGSALLQHR
jgi:hypothetical protein